MWPFDILAKRRERQEIARKKHHEDLRASFEQKLNKAFPPSSVTVAKITPSSLKDSSSSSGYGGFTDFSNPASPLNPIHQTTFYSSPSSSYDSCSSSSSSYDSGSSSSSDSGSSSSSCY